MALKIETFTCTAPSPKAGEAFQLIVQLNKEVQGKAVNITLEKQRIVLGSGGFPELRPTGQDYFETGFDPNPITVKIGSRTGTSDPIKVKTKPSAGNGEVPIAFPERLLFTAFDIETPSSPSFRVIVVPVLAPDHTP